jgi:hypothetical protein
MFVDYDPQDGSSVVSFRRLHVLMRASRSMVKPGGVSIEQLVPPLVKPLHLASVRDIDIVYHHVAEIKEE